jgi:hypothetical protein
MFGLMPFLMIFHIRADVIIGSPLIYWVVWPFGVTTMLLGVNVKDRQTIRCLLGTLLVVNACFALILTLYIYNDIITRGNAFSPQFHTFVLLPIALTLAGAAFLIKPLCAGGDDSIWTPELKLLRVWRVMRFLMAGFGVGSFGIYLQLMIAGGRDPNFTSGASLSFLINAILPMPWLRSRLLRGIVRLGKKGADVDPEEEEAIAILFPVGPEGGGVRRADPVAPEKIGGGAAGP